MTEKCDLLNLQTLKQDEGFLAPSSSELREGAEKLLRERRKNIFEVSVRKLSALEKIVTDGQKRIF